MAKSISAIFTILVLISSITVYSGIPHAHADHIPELVKNNALWYGQGAISETEYINAIKFLIEEGILQLEEKQTQQASSGDWLSDIHSSITSAVKQIQANPTADLVVKSVLPVIPVAGPLLANLYENASGTTSEKNAQILKILEEYQKMDNEQLQKSFAKLEENKELIKTNQYKLNDVLVDTKLLIKGQEEIRNQLKAFEEKFDAFVAQHSLNKVDPSKIGKISEETRNELDEKEKEIKQLRSQIEQLTGEKLDVDIENLAALANSKLYAEEDEEAIELYMQILEVDEKNYDALNGLGWVHIFNDKPKEALKWFNQVLEHHPGDADTYEEIAWAYYDDDNPTEAIVWFDKTINADPEWAYGYIGKGSALIKLGDYEQAEELCLIALDIEPDNEDAMDCADGIPVE